MRGSAYAQIMRMCADNAPSACIMRGCVLCADYAQMRMVRMVCMYGAAQHAHMRTMRICACALLRSMRRGRPPRGKAPRAAYPFVFSRGRAKPSKGIDFRAPAKGKSAQWKSQSTPLPHVADGRSTNLHARGCENCHPCATPQLLSLWSMSDHAKRPSLPCASTSGPL